MRRTSGKTMLAVLLVTPVVCCFVGTGAFLHLSVFLVTANVEETDAMRRHAEDLARRAAELEKELAGIEQRIAELRRKLGESQQDAETVRKLEEALRNLLARKGQVAAELASIRRALAAAEKALSQKERQVQQARSEAEKARQEIEASRQKLAQLQAAVAREVGGATPPSAENAAPPGSGQELRSRIARQKGQLEAERVAGERLDAQLGGLKRKPLPREVKVLSFTGSQAWDAPRDLVYVECDGQGVIVQPEGTRLPVDPNGDQRTKYLDAVKRTGYALLLVRPSGVKSFATYLDLLKNSPTRLDYGYEPVNEDWELVYPQKGGERRWGL